MFVSTTTKSTEEIAKKDEKAIEEEKKTFIT